VIHIENAEKTGAICGRRQGQGGSDPDLWSQVDALRFAKDCLTRGYRDMCLTCAGTQILLMRRQLAEQGSTPPPWLGDPGFFRAMINEGRPICGAPVYTNGAPTRWCRLPPRHDGGHLW
jgi:hypothetical protein